MSEPRLTLSFPDGDRAVEARGLSLWQPWGSLICPGPGIEPLKWIETRSWRTKYVGWVLICATVRNPLPFSGDGGQYTCGGRIYVARTGSDLVWQPVDGSRDLSPSPPALPLGAVLGVAYLSECLQIVGYQTDAWLKLVRSDAPQDYISNDSAWDGFPPLKIIRERTEGTSRVSEVTQIEDQWEFGNFDVGRYGWCFTDIRSLPTPIPVKGARNLWDPTAPEHGDLLERVSAALATP